MGPRCACRGEASVGRGGLGANDRGGHVSSCLHRIVLLCSSVVCQCFRWSMGFRSGCWLPLGSAMGPRYECRGEAGVVRGGRGANGRGGHGSSCLDRIMFFCSGVFCQGFRRGKGFRSGCWLPLGSAMGPRCACRGEAGGKCENKNFAGRRQKKIFSQKRKFQKKVTFTSKRALLSARFRSQIKNPYKIGFMASVLDDL